jgi:hypothetical protein
VNVGLQYILVAGAAGFVGLAELVARYKSDPWYMLRHSFAAWLYMVINVAAGLLALVLIRAFGWFGGNPHADIWRTLIAGFTAIAFFRSSLFVTNIGGTSVGVGPSMVLGALLDACDRQVDRMSAEKILDVLASDPLNDVHPAQVMYALPVLCLALMQNFSASDQAQLGAELTKIRADDKLSEQARMHAIVLQLARALSSRVVTKVLTSAGVIFRELPVRDAPLPPTDALIAETKRQMEETATAADAT